MPQQPPKAPKPQTPPPGHARRVVGFIGKVVRQLKTEFAEAWEASAVVAEDTSVPFSEQLRRLDRQIEAAEQALAGGAAPSPAQVQRLIEAAKETRARAEALEADPAVAAARRERLRTAPLDAKRPTGSWPPPPVVRNPGRAAPPSEPAARLAQARVPFEAAHEFVSRALHYAEPRLSLVEVAVTALGLPGPPPPWPQVKIRLNDLVRQSPMPPARLHWLVTLTHALHGSAEAARLAQVAVVQWQRAKALMQEAERVRAIAEEAPPTLALAAMENFDHGRFRASAFPLGHLHLTFRGHGMLQDLFPPPAATSLPPRQA